MQARSPVRPRGGVGARERPIANTAHALRRGARDEPVIIGVAGHRDAFFPRARRDAITREIERVIAAIRDGSQTPPIVLSALAEGADRLAARSALAAGLRLHAIRPNDLTRFAAFFANDGSLEEYLSLLGASEVVHEVEARRAFGDAAYFGALAEELARRCCVLIAVWDGRWSRRSGGTSDMVRRVLLRGVPVVWIHARRDSDSRVLLLETARL